jgi:hypothetical protein
MPPLAAAGADRLDAATAHLETVGDRGEGRCIL